MLKKNIKAGKANFLLVILFFILTINNLLAEGMPKSEKIAELSVLDKVSSKNTIIKIMNYDQTTVLNAPNLSGSSIKVSPELTFFSDLDQITITKNLI